MKSIILFSIILIFQFNIINAQVSLDADGPGNTYELINSVLAPGFNVIEAPGEPAGSGTKDNHSAFGRHIDEILDASLGINVFRFVIHRDEDNDRGIITTTDRQRNEIKIYDKSPNNLKGVEGESFVYKWKFKLPVGFQSSSNFTHIHQLKSVGGLYEATPMYTLTTRKGTPDKLELRYAEAASQSTLIQTDLTPFKGIWVDVTESIKYGSNSGPNSGTYSILIKKVSDDSELFSYTNSSIKNWQTDADFVRPKWGIYRSLLNQADLRNEEVLFANFSIEETGTLSINNSEFNKNAIRIIPNPATHETSIIETTPNSFNTINIYDNLGRLLNVLKPISKTINVSNLKSGIYYLQFKNDDSTISTRKLVVN
jgi:hypothetical protein